jgi:hypothetical protein
VSVGGLLALDQVLKSTWSYLTIFGTMTACQGWSTTQSEIKEARPIFGFILRFWVDVMGKGCRPVGLPMLRPIF